MQADRHATLHRTCTHARTHTLIICFCFLLFAWFFSLSLSLSTSLSLSLDLSLDLSFDLSLDLSFVIFLCFWQDLKMEAVIADPVTSRAFANAALETHSWVERVTHSQTRDVLVLKKLKNSKKLAPGELKKIEPTEAEAYTDKFYDALVERWGDFAPINTQCREALKDFAGQDLLFAHVYQDHMMAFCIVRLVSGTRARIATCITPRPYRGRGFGKALLCNVVKHLRKENGIKEVLLFMDEGDPGVNLYANIGFVSEATMHIYEVVLANSATVGRRFSLMDGTSLAHGRTSFSTPVRPGTSDTTASRGSFDTQQLVRA